MLDSNEVGGGLKWVVRSRDMKFKKVVEKVFDVVVVAIGQYSHPRFPSIRGMSNPTFCIVGKAGQGGRKFSQTLVGY